MSRRFDPDQYNEGHRASQIAIACWVSGGVLVAAGAAMYWYGITLDRRADALALVPTVSDHHAGLAVTGSF